MLLRVSFRFVSRVYFVRARVTALDRDLVSSVPVIGRQSFSFRSPFFFYPPALLVLICRFRFPSPTLARRKRHSAAAGIHPSPGGTGNGGKENEAATIVVAGSRDDHGRRVARQVVWTHTPPIRIVSWILHAFFFLSNRVESEKRERRLKLSSCRNRSRWPGLGFYCCSAVCRGWLLLLLLLLLLTECCAASLRQFRRDSCGMTHSIRCSVK